MGDKGTQDLTYLRIGGDAVGWVTSGHVGTHWDTTGHNDTNGT